MSVIWDKEKPNVFDIGDRVRMYKEPDGQSAIKYCNHNGFKIGHSYKITDLRGSFYYIDGVAFGTKFTEEHFVIDRRNINLDKLDKLLLDQ